MNRGELRERHEKSLFCRNYPIGRFGVTFGRQIPLSLMGQYFPSYRAMSLPGHERRLSTEEYGRAVRTARRLGHHDVFIQEI